MHLCATLSSPKLGHAAVLAAKRVSRCHSMNIHSVTHQPCGPRQLGGCLKPLSALHRGCSGQSLATSGEVKYSPTF